MFTLTPSVTMSEVWVVLKLHVSVSMLVFLSKVLNEPLIPQLDCAAVHPDLVRLYAVLISFSGSDYCAFFLPLAIDVVLDDNSVINQKFINCHSSFLER